MKHGKRKIKLLLSQIDSFSKKLKEQFETGKGYEEKDGSDWKKNGSSIRKEWKQYEEKEWW